MRSFNVILVIEISLAIIISYIFISTTNTPYLYLEGWEKEDLYSSLISINYMNISNEDELNQTLYKVVNNILPEYYVMINNTLYFNNSDLEKCKKSIRTFYIINGSFYFIDIYYR